MNIEDPGPESGVFSRTNRLSQIHRRSHPATVPALLLSLSLSLSLPTLILLGFVWRGQWEAPECSDRRRRIGDRKADGSMSEFEPKESMGLEKRDLSENHKGSVLPSCSICLEFVLDRGERSIAKLQCGHEFHLDCIGSAFNAKGTMQCPNCRKVEKGRWLYANGLRPSIDFDLDGLITEDIYDFSYSELPFGFQWCPFGGFTGLTSLLEDSELQPNSYHDPLGSSTFGDHSSASTSTHVCPYLPLHHTMPFAPSNSTDSVPEIAPFHRHPTNPGGQPPAEILNPYSYSASEAQNSHWIQQSLPPAMNMAGNSDQGTTSHNGLGLPRNDSSNQQRLGSFVHAHPLQNGSIAPRSRSNLVASSMGPAVMGDIRPFVRGHGNHVHQQSVSSSSPSVQTSPFGPDRRSRPRGLTLISTSSSADLGFYGFSLSGSISRGHQDADRHFDRVYWGREGFHQPLPWIPHDGDSRWWGPFNPNQSPQPGNFPPRGSTTGERVAQNRSESGFHQRLPLPHWMPPPPYM